MKSDSIASTEDFETAQRLARIQHHIRKLEEINYAHAPFSHTKTD